MHELPAPLTQLIDAALGGDDPEDLLRAAHRELDRPLGLVGPAGQALAYVPRGDGGERALAVAAAGARSRLVAPPGWTIVPVAHGAAVLGVLAFGGEREEMLELVVLLLGEQLQRRALLRGRLDEFLRRLVGDADAPADELQREAAELGLELADRYWVAVLSWRHAPPVAALLEALEPGAGLAIAHHGRIVLLHPPAGAGRPAWFDGAVLSARRHAPSAGVQAIATDAPVALPELGARAAELEGLSRLALRADGDALVISARRYSLDRLLAQTVARPETQAFVAEQLGALIAWDREHHGDLLTVLEAALDYPRHELAASRCYMHRNTFRHRLRQATDILRENLEDPDRRLALHVALKLHRSLAARPRRLSRARR